MLYERLALPVLFRLGRGDPERAHEWTLARLSSLSRRPVALAALRAIFAVNAPVEVFGLRFANPVGLAAGMDKDGLALAAWPALGFGFVEVGTVTSDPQQGNDGPRLHRLPESAAVINRMGFNNAGAAALARRLAAAQPLGVPLGISLGKSRSTPLAEAVGDYLRCLQLVYEYGDYFAVNVSSPNTPDLRGLQERAHLEQLLAALREGTRRLAGPDREPKPLLVKIDPDLTEPALAELVEVCLAEGVAGVIATNTTTERTGLAPADVVRADQPGGLSGAPLAARSRAVVAFVSRQAGGKLPIVGVGGVHHSDDARALVDAGASLVQLFTGLIYRGPGLVRRTARALRAARPATRVQDVPANRVYEGRRG